VEISQVTTWVYNPQCLKSLTLWLKIVVKALNAAKVPIVEAVKYEIKQLNTPEDCLDEVNEEMLRKLPELLNVLAVKLWINEKRKHNAKNSRTLDGVEKSLHWSARN
jgi:hypothetical protein